MSRLEGALALLAAGCAPPPFELVHHDFGPAGAGALNQPLRFEFSAAVDPGSVRPEVIEIFDPALEHGAEGSFTVEGRIVTFTPRGPTDADLRGGFRAGARYVVLVPGLPRLRCIRGRAGAALRQGQRFEFATAPSSDPHVLRDLVPGPPLLVTTEVTVTLTGGAVELRFSEPLDPRPLADARFRLKGPWSRAAHPAANPPLRARLTENSRHAILAIEIDPATLPSPLVAGESYHILLDVPALRDCGGQALPLDRSAGDVVMHALPVPAAVPLPPDPAKDPP